MFSALWLKTWRDLWLYKKQSFAVVAAIVISSLTLGIILMSYAFLSRALEENYQLSSPSMLSYNLSGLSNDLKVQTLSDHPDIERVELSRQIFGRITNQQGESFPLLLFVVRDFANMQLDIVDLEDGHWPDAAGQIVIEKQALSLLQASKDETVSITSPSGLLGDARIVAIGHDVSVHQAQWENIVYGYVDAATLQFLGGEPGFDIVKVSIKTGIESGNKQHVRHVGNNIAGGFSRQNINVKNMQVASGEPPHSNITNGMFMIQIAFGVMCSLLSVVLVVNLISAILSKQKRQIGIMKSLGARPHHIRKVYLQSTLTLCLIGVLLAVPLAWWLAVIYANALAHMMNIEIFSYQIPLWVLVVLLFTGCVVPLITLMYPIVMAAKTSIKQTLMDYHDSAYVQLPRWLALLTPSIKKPASLKIPPYLKLPRLPIFDNELRFARRNVYRSKTRFLLSSMVLAFGGAILISGFNISKSMNLAIDVDRESRQWHAMVKFNKNMDRSVLMTSLSDEFVPFYQSAAHIISASSDYDPAPAPAIKPAFDQEHEAIGLLQLETPENLLQPKMQHGEWFGSGVSAKGKNSHYPPIVFSHTVSNLFPQYQIGDTVNLDNGTTYYLAGIAQVFGRPVLYTSNSAVTISAGVDPNWRVNGLFLTRPGLIQEAIDAINSHQLRAVNIVKADETAKVILDHFEIIFAMMMVLTLVTLFIATNGTILTVSINIQERMREIAVLKAMGASRGSINVIVLGESVWSAILAWCLACLISVPISYALSYWFGILLISTPLPSGISAVAIVFCLPALVLVALISAYIPARKIMKMPIKDAIASG